MISIDRGLFLPIRMIAIIIVLTFFTQDIVWSYPDLSSHDRPDNAKLAPASFDRRHTLEDKVATSLVLMIEQNHRILPEKLTLEGVEAVLNKAEVFLAYNKVSFSRTDGDITIYITPDLVLRYSHSDSARENLPGFKSGPQENLGALVRRVFTKKDRPRAPEQLRLDFTDAKDPKTAKPGAVKRQGAAYRNNLKRLLKYYDSKKAGDKVIKLLKAISNMDWRAYRIPDDASNNDRLEYISLNAREMSVRLQKMMGDAGALGFMANLKVRLKKTIVPLLTDYLAEDKASHDATGPKRLPGVEKFAEPLEKYAGMMIAISKMKRGDEGLAQEEGSSHKSSVIPLKARKEIFIIGEKCAEIARQLRLLDRSDEIKAVSDALPRSQNNKIVSKLIPAEEFASAAAKQVAHRLASYQYLMQGNVNIVLAQSEMTAEFLKSLAGESGVDWSRVNILALSGYTGVSRQNALSFRDFIQKYLSDNLPKNKIPPSDNIYDLSDRSIEEYEKGLQGALYPHIVILGLGMNGELGYNEPGGPFNSVVREVMLADEAGHNFTARTLGISEITSAFSIFILAGSEDKDMAVKALFGPITTDVPASILQIENVAENLTVLFSDDKTAAYAQADETSFLSQPADLMQVADTPEEAMAILLPNGPEGAKSGIAAAKPEPAGGGIDHPDRWTAEAPEISRRTDDKGRITITIPGYSADRFTIGAGHANQRMVLRPLDGNWLKGFNVYFENKFIGTCYPVSDEFIPAEIRRPTDYKGRFSVTMPGYRTNRFNLGAAYESRNIKLTPYTNDDWAGGFVVNVKDEATAAYRAIAVYNAADNIFGLFKDTRVLDEGRFYFGGVRYILDVENAPKDLTGKIILRAFKDFDWMSGFTVELNGSQVASYDKKSGIMTGMYIAGMSALKDAEKLTTLHNLFMLGISDKHIKDDTRILLSESLFTSGADDSELVQVRIALGSFLKSGHITIMRPEEIRLAAMNQNVSKNKLAIVLTRADFDNKEVWSGSDKEASLKSSVLILDDKFIGSNYLYLEGVIGLAQAMMANNKQAIRRYYELISGASIGDEIMNLLDDDSQNNVAFAIKAVLRFRPIGRIDPGDLNEMRIKMENALIAA